MWQTQGLKRLFPPVWGTKLIPKENEQLGERKKRMLSRNMKNREKKRLKNLHYHDARNNV